MRMHGIWGAMVLTWLAFGASAGESSAAKLRAGISGRGGTETAETARREVRAAIEAMGGEARLRGLHTLQIVGIGHRYMVEQSERPEGPWMVDYFQVKEIRDYDHARLKQEKNSRGCGSTECWKSADWSPSALVVAEGVAANVQGGKMSAARASAAQDAEEAMALGPERVLLTALAAGDLHAEADTAMRGFTHHVVAFTWQGHRARLYLSGTTRLPTAVDFTRPEPYTFFLSPWGDVTTRTIFSLWQMEPGGLRYPRQWNFETNGQPDWTFTVNEVAINPSANDEDFAIPEDVRRAFAARRKTIEEIALGLPNDPPQELAPGIFQVRGFWNVAEVKQDDGIVIIEGPISNGYSAKVIEDAEKRFAGSRVKAVITTSDSFPHIGGMREYAARGIMIYALDLNRTILERLFAAPHETNPDALAAHKPVGGVKITYVSKRISLGRGANRLEIVPFREVSGERQMMVYFPETRLLYSSDLFQRDNSGAFFLPQMLSEAVDAVERERLDVTTDFGMHIGPTPWKSVEAAVAAQAQGGASGAQ